MAAFPAPVALPADASAVPNGSAAAIKVRSQIFCIALVPFFRVFKQVGHVPGRYAARSHMQSGAEGVALAAQAIKPAVTDPEPLAPLYGRADHLKRQDAALSFGDRVQLALRALYLLAVFAPFLLLGVPLLLAAACLPAPPEPQPLVTPSSSDMPHDPRRCIGRVCVRSAFCAGSVACRMSAFERHVPAGYIVGKCPRTCQLLISACSSSPLSRPAVNFPSPFC